jgi:hypothetical protein
LSALGKKAYQTVKIQDPEYTSEFDLLVRRPYISEFKKETSILEDFARSSSQARHKMANDDLETSFNEKFSDSCYSSLLVDDDNKSGKRCNLDPNCIEYYTDKRASGYFLTHQLLFLMIVEKVRVYSFLG